MQPAILGTARLGNFRLGYVPAALAALRRVALRITLDGVAGRVRVGSVTIHDVLNDAPNTCALVVDPVALSSLQYPYADAVLAAGAIGYWRLGDLSGAVATDTAVPAHVGAYVGGVTLASAGALADGNTAPLFNGSSGLVSVPYTAALNPASALSIEFWVKPTGSANAMWVLKSGGGAYWYIEEVTGTHLNISFHSDMDTHTVTPSPWPLGQWTHIVVTYDGANAYCYFNGSQIATWANAAGIATNTGPITIGGGGSTFFAGTMQDVALYAHVLTPTQVAQHYALRTAAAARVFTVGPAPQVAQTVRVTIGTDTPRLLFNGTLQAVDLSYEGLPARVVYPCRAIDDTAFLNRRRPIGTWTDVSATTIAQSLLASFAPGFTGTHIAAALPALSITFDGSEEFSACLKRIATAIGGYFYVEDGDLHLFQEEATATPDPIDDSHPFLNSPPITMNVDVSQLRTRVYGKGHGENVPTDVAAAAAIVPVTNGVMFNPAGGKAIAGTTPDGAQSQIVAYTGVQLGGIGSLVGPGASPAAAPVLALASGAGVETGAHGYAATFVTAAGESLPGPIATVTVGVVAPPSSAPIPSSPALGTGPDDGNHDYVVTFVTAAGETTPSAIGPYVTTGPTNVVLNPPSGAPSPFALGTGSMVAGTYKYGYTFVAATGETTASPTGSVTSSGGDEISVPGIATGPSGTTARKVYRSVAGGSQLKYLATIANNSATTYNYDNAADGSLGANAPTSNTATVTTPQNQVPLTQIPLGGALVTARKIYRRFNGTGTFKLVTTIANNTAPTYTDTTANSGLGANAPSSNTATANQVDLSGVPIGAASVTSRKIYRTVAGGAQLKLQQTIANNTATTGVTDATADASLGANVPTLDTSGLTQPNGQVVAGSTSVVVAGTGAFSSSGGWAIIGNGQQVIRYTGLTAGSLTGVPASGPGAIVASIGYNSTITAAPALTGVTGLTLAMQKGAAVNIWVQRDDVAAQTAMIAIAGGDGIYEYQITDERRGEASLIAQCDADLALFSRPLVTVTYATRDLKTKSGKPIVITLASPLIGATLTIQDVTISELGIAPGLAPTFTVTASSVRWSLEDLLRRMAA